MATSIASYSVGLNLDASGYISGGRLSRAETAAIVRQINAARDPTEKYMRSVNQLENAHRKGAIETGTYNRLLDAAKTKLHNLQSATDQTAKATTSWTSSAMAGVSRLVAAYAGLQTIKKAVALGIQVEQAETQLEVLTDSANNAKFLMGELRDFAARSPITFTGATDAAKTMLMFDVQVQDVMRNVQALGDITGGNNERFKNMTLAFSQMTSAGRLLGQDLRQMVDAGFNPLQQISKTTGESMIELKKRMEDGGVSAAEVTQAFIDATSAGGRFDGMTERMSETMGGKLTIAMSELELVAVRLSDALSPLIIQLTSGFSAGIGPLSAILGIVEKMSDGFGFLVAVATDAAHAVTMPFKALSGTLEENEIPHAINDYLDLLDKRDQERAAAAAQKDLKLEVPDVAQAAVGFGDKFGGLIDSAVEGLRSKLNNPATFDVIPDAVRQGLGQAYQMMETNARALQIADAEIAKLSSNSPLAKSAAQGSQEAYSIIVGAQNTSAAKQLAETQRHTALLAANLRAQEEANRLIAAQENPLAGVM